MSKTKSRLRNAGVGLAAAGALAVGFIGNWEGLRLYAYKDVIGVWTACYGETKDIKPGMKFTKQQCDVMFIDRLEEFEAGMRKCLAKPDELPIKVYVADLSLSYNIGIGAFCKSSIVKLQNEGKLKESCDRFLLFNKAGGKVVQGLVNRRKEERKLCLAGL